MSSSDYKEVCDSGERRSFDTGSVRDIRNGKGRYDLIPAIFMHRLAVHFENGAKKYGDRNWEKGQPVSVYYDSALRHLFKYESGSREEDHLAAAAWNICGMICTQEWCRIGRLPKELDEMEHNVDKERVPSLLDIGF